EEMRPRLTAIDTRIAEANLLIARSAIVGGRAARTDGETRAAGFQGAVDAGMLAAESAERPLPSPTGESGAETATNIGDGVVLTAAATTAYNNRPRPHDLGDIVLR